MSARSREVYAKMAAGLDRNRKIRKGGRDARDVYLWVLRRVAERGSTSGRIPADDVMDAEYLADELMCSEEEARIGLERAIDVKLLAVDGDDCVVIGWDDEWGRKPMTASERVAKHRASVTCNDATVTEAKDVTTQSLHVTPQSLHVTPQSLHVTANVTCNPGEESKESKERIGEKESGKPDDQFPRLFDLGPEPAEPRVPAAVLLLAETACAEINELTGSKYQPKAAATVQLCRALANARHTTDEVRMVVHEKHREWGGDPVMRRRVCPATLLALSNFEKYLDEIQSRPDEEPTRPTADFDD